MGNDNNRWKIEDLIDFEYFLHHQDASDGDKNLSTDAEDREIFLEQITPSIVDLPDAESPDRSFILRKWLESKRDIEKNKKGNSAYLPGDIFLKTYTLAVYFFIIFALTGGFGAAFSFMAYKGHAPINVSSFFGLFILPQVVLLVVLGLTLLFFRKSSLFSQVSVFRFLIDFIILKLAFFFRKHTMENMSSEKRAELKAAMGIIKGKTSVYGRIFPWPAFILAQVFGVFFNIGVLLATLLRVVGSDLAFGWQSTLKIGADAVYKLVNTIALPWSWAVSEPLSNPTVSQIEGTRMILKDGISSMTTPDLISWWPFLCFTLAFYALLPRVIFLLGGLWGRRSALVKIDFQSIACDKLMLRMTTPILSTEGEEQEGKVGALTLKASGENIVVASETIPSVKPEPVFTKDVDVSEDVITLVPEDIIEEVNDTELEHHIKRLFNARLLKKIEVTLEFSEDKEIITALSDQMGKNILLLMEGWQAPIKETLYYLEELRQTLGKDVRVYILLTGKPTPETIFTPTAEGDVRIWEQRINALGDPNLCIEHL